jgi:6-phosphofructokinase 1
MAERPTDIAVFTSGGDSPGMNACIRAVVRTGIANSVRVHGIYRGYDGMIAGEIGLLQGSDVSNIIQRGGTVLKSARSKAFLTPEGRAEAHRQLAGRGITGVVAIGGDGTFAGAKVFCHEYPEMRFIGLPGTIDNDLSGTDYTIGYDTAINTVVEAVDRIRDTAASHDRLFFVEVMGKDAGFIALASGISAGAEAILVPETQTDIDALIARLAEGWKRAKSSSIIIVAEGDDAGNAYQIAEQVKGRLPHFDTRVTVLGHIQRGGNPTANDRILASRLGHEAVLALVRGEGGHMLGLVNGEVRATPFAQAIKMHGKMDLGLLRMAEVLAS